MQEKHAAAAAAFKPSAKDKHSASNCTPRHKQAVKGTQRGQRHLPPLRAQSVHKATIRRIALADESKRTLHPLQYLYRIASTQDR
jgi:hypothetical protein